MAQVTAVRSSEAVRAKVRRPVPASTKHSYYDVHEERARESLAAFCFVFCLVLFCLLKLPLIIQAQTVQHIDWMSRNFGSLA